jgi:hypothetical protein
VCWNRNFTPSRRSLSRDQSRRSASVARRRKGAAWGLIWRFTGGTGRTKYHARSIIQKPVGGDAKTPLPSLRERRGPPRSGGR